MIYTVKGPIKKEELGRTMSHEHFKWEVEESHCDDMYYKRSYNEERTQDLYDKILPVVNHLKGVGCEAIVETSPPIGGQNLKLLYQLSAETGIHIIPCTGWNTTKYVADIFIDSYVEAMSKRWIEDFEKGLDTIDGTLIKPGYIKLLLDRGPLNHRDQKMLEAAIIASKSTGIGIHCHILEAEHVKPVIDLLKERDYPMNRFLWAHADEESCRETIEMVAKTGAYIGFDNIHPKDYEQRFELLKWAIDAGYEDQLLLSEDYEFYVAAEDDDIEKCGQLLATFIPQCISQGISSSVLEKILTMNPAEFYDVE